MLKLELSFAEVAAKNVAALPAKSDAPPASVARRNSRRLMPLQAPPPLLSKAELLMAPNLGSHGIFSRTKFGRFRPDIPRLAE
jgi:hypothetical protein